MMLRVWYLRWRLRRYTRLRAALVWFRFTRMKFSRAPADRFVHDANDIIDGVIKTLGGTPKR
jgi:hypothetical protein